MIWSDPWTILIFFGIEKSVQQDIQGYALNWEKDSVYFQHIKRSVNDREDWLTWTGENYFVNDTGY